MSGSSSVPPITFGANGYVAPSEGAILAGVQADQDAAFGGNLNPALETPQGQLATSTTAIIGDKNDEFLLLANNVDPAYASGRFQDAIARIYFLTRTPAEPTTCTATCTGLSGTVIPPGARAVDTSTGNIYTATDGGTIPIGGSIDLNFACSITGAIPLPANSLTQIYQAIAGWDTVNNAADGVLGNAVESRSAFEARRAASVAINARNTLASIRGEVLAVANVLDAYVTQNNTSAPVTIGGVSLVANSVYVCVSGGVELDVATAIFNKLPPGCDMNGSTTVSVQDTQSGYSPPYPTYDISFQEATALPIKFSVTIANNSLVPSNASTLIQNAIISAFAGGDGGSRAQIGATVFASRFYAPVAALGSWVEIISILVGTVTANQNSVSVNIDHIPTVSGGDIAVVIA